ncbi:MAG: hypothetical protein K1X53_01135 [Candidatus Sumerlaeaceae bacterium]|nr:hypothetical protein [Candidatus Sumerlaeaceae bacterium]
MLNKALRIQLLLLALKVIAWSLFSLYLSALMPEANYQCNDLKTFEPFFQPLAVGQIFKTFKNVKQGKEFY